MKMNSNGSASIHRNIVLNMRASRLTKTAQLNPTTSHHGNILLSADKGNQKLYNKTLCDLRQVKLQSDNNIYL